LSQMYKDNIAEFERAINIRKELEERIRQLEKLETNLINDLKLEFAQREEKYQEAIIQLQEDYDRYKRDVEREFRLKDIIIKRGEEYGQLLKKELIVAQSIIKTPLLSKKAAEDLNNQKFSTY
jgi:ABC-type Na+ transport system ATPase subunit NatA